MEHPNPEYVSALKKVVKDSPYPAQMQMTLEEIEINTARLMIRLGKRHLQPFGIVHGGVLATIIDTATFFAAFLKLPVDTGLVNVDLKLNYLAPVIEGHLYAEGTCLHLGRSISYTEARFFDDQKNLVAHGTSTLMAIPGKGLLNLGVDKFLLGNKE